jgi:hypothetical protein
LVVRSERLRVIGPVAGSARLGLHEGEVGGDEDAGRLLRERIITLLGCQLASKMIATRCALANNCRMPEHTLE